MRSQQGRDYELYSVSLQISIAGFWEYLIFNIVSGASEFAKNGLTSLEEGR